MSKKEDYGLPAQEANLFRALTKHYDQGKNDKALSIADQILAKFPKHAETLSMKGLTLHAMYQDAVQNGKAEPHAADEGIKLLKLAIAADIKSAFCWHALGSHHRSEKQGAEALKCFKMAFLRDPECDNSNIVRDVSSQAIQQRDWELYAEVRQKALNAKANTRERWITYAAAQYMLGHHALAAGIIDVMIQVLDAGDNAVETNELYIFRAELALQCKKGSEALKMLEKVTDKGMRTELTAQAHVLNGNKKKAEEAYDALLTMQRAERDVLFALAKLRGINDVKPAPKYVPEGAAVAPKPSAAFVALLDEVAEKHPRCDAAKRLALDYCAVDELEKRVRSYCAPYVRKTIPSLNSVLKSLYADSARVAVVERVFTEWENKLDADDATPFVGAAVVAEDKCATRMWALWVKLFLASHFRRSGKHELALAYIEKCIAHTPTVEMLYLEKAEILGAMGKDKEAAEAADMGRLLDLQDRYMCNEAVRFFLRANDIATADARMALFLKPTDVSPLDVHLTMFENQVHWYSLELGNCHLRQGDALGALEALLQLERQHEDNHNELQDFHAYTLRRSNIHAWLDVIQTEDNFHRTQFFLQFAPSLIRSYLLLADDGVEKCQSRRVKRPDFEEKKPSPEEQKRLAKLVKEHVPAVDTTVPLEKCKPYVAALQAHLPTWAETHELAFEVALRRGKPLQCAAALKALGSADVVNGAAKLAQLKPKLAAWVKVNEASMDAAVVKPFVLAALK